MRAIFGILGLLLVVAIVGVLVKKQLAPGPLRTVPAGEPVVLPAPQTGTTAQQQSLQLQKQVRESLDATLQQTRPMPEDK